MWTTEGYVSEHAVSTRVEPTIGIVMSGTGNPAVITTAGPHGYVTGDTVRIDDHVASPPIDGEFVVTVLTPTTFSIPTNGGGQPGAGGTVTRTIPVEPLTLAQGKLRAGLDWTDGDPRDDLMKGFITTARQHVEKRTERALLSQTRDVYMDALPGWIIEMPSLCTPLQAVVSVAWIDTANAPHILDPSTYVVDLVSGRIGLTMGWNWPSGLRAFQPWQLRVVAGAPTIAQIPAPLLQAVGLLVGHLATLGRDLALTTSAIISVPQGFEDLIAPWVPVALP